MDTDVASLLVSVATVDTSSGRRGGGRSNVGLLGLVVVVDKLFGVLSGGRGHF